ncbi:MAG: phosphoglycerate kinase [Bacteroidales bacterium]|nr:phosphoglycerate kinase [Bacteroidales bacterium]
MTNINSYDFAGKKAIVRVDFNVPLQDGKITDDTRIRGAVPTLKLILEKGGALIIMSHMGKPKGKKKPELSLGQIKEAVAAALGVAEVKFAPDCADASEAAAALKPGEVLLLENLRYYPEEEGKPVGIDKEDPAYDEAKKAMKASQKEFAKKLASYADCYVMDAFGTAHRKHASTAVIADYFAEGDKMLGLLMEKEVNAVDAVLNNIQRPFVAVMGGSKVSSKIGIIENLLGKVDKLILCGGMTYTFSKAHGGEIGTSIVELDKLDVALGVEELAKKNGVELVLAEDATITNGLDFGTMTVKEGAEVKVAPANAIPEGFEGVDAGPKAQAAFAAALAGAKTILWNGPAGVFECDAFTAGSRAIGEAIAKATAEGAFSLIGGGDSVACVNKFGLADQVSYISTGGGALLEAIEGKVLPGVAAIKGE